MILSLQQLIEEIDAKTASVHLYIGGALISRWTNISYQFEMGQVPSASITFNSWNDVPPAVVEEASVEIWFGYTSGMVNFEKLVFGGAVVDSIGNNGPEVVVECVMDGGRKLSYSYNRRIDFDFAAIDATDAVLGLLELAGVSNFAVNLDPWIIGTAVPQTIQFSTYGEAINKIAEVDGSPWYCMPSGQLRVDRRDPVPSESWHRIYFTGVLTGAIESQPDGVSNTDARPLITNLQLREFRDQVANFIEVDGAVVVSLGPNGEQNSDQIVEQVDGLSGQFPNGAYWIPTPPLFQDFNFSNELIDTNAKAFAVAERYFALKNRLFQEYDLSVPGDPDVFLGETVKVIDLQYSRQESLYFVKGYRTSIDRNTCTTELSLTGGPEAGTTGFASPFADFIWKYQAVHHIIGGAPYNFGVIDLGPGASLGSKLCIDITAGTGSIDLGGGVLPGFDHPAVIIAFDGTVSDDFDGQIASWEWADDQGHTGSGPRILVIYDPDSVSLIQMTLTVTDNSGRTDSITKTVFTTADHANVPGQQDPAVNDTFQGGGVEIGECTEPEDFVCDGCDGTGLGGEIGPGGCNGMGTAFFIAAGAYAMGSRDNHTWNDIDKATAGVVGDFISVAAASDFSQQRTLAVFGTTSGEIFLSTDYCVTGSVVFIVPSLGDAVASPRIECIWFDSQGLGISNIDPLPGIEDSGSGNPVNGTLTIEEAYRLCLEAGFPATSAVYAVAIMIRESGLQSHPPDNINPGPPVSRDRGIAQFNDVYHPEVSDACAYDPACAIRAMYRVSSGGTDFSAWATYNNGSFASVLAQVQAAVGVAGDPAQFDPNSGSFSNVVAPSLRVFAGTSDGRIYVSNDGGTTWELYAQINDGYPIYAIGTPPGGSIWAFGGDTLVPDSLIKIDPDGSKNFVSLAIGGDLLAAIQAAGPGFSIKCSSVNDTASFIGFTGGVSPAIWVSQDPIGDPESWFPAVGAPAGPINASAPGFGGDFIAVDDDTSVYGTVDDINYAAVGSSPSPINRLFWTHLESLYFAAADGGLLQSVDKGVSWGYMRPNGVFGTTWPGGAIGYDMAFAVGPRLCIDPVVSFIAYQGANAFVSATNGFVLLSDAYDADAVPIGIAALSNGSAMVEFLDGIFGDPPGTTTSMTLIIGQTLVAGDIQVLAVVSRIIGSIPEIPSVSTVSGAAVTWELVRTLEYDNEYRLSLFVGVVTTSDPPVQLTDITWVANQESAFAQCVRINGERKTLKAVGMGLSSAGPDISVGMSSGEEAWDHIVTTTGVSLAALAAEFGFGV